MDEDLARKFLEFEDNYILKGLEYIGIVVFWVLIFVDLVKMRVLRLYIGKLLVNDFVNIICY